jgi:hypothetical protein
LDTGGSTRHRNKSTHTLATDGAEIAIKINHGFVEFIFIFYNHGNTPHAWPSAKTQQPNPDLNNYSKMP